MAPDPALFLLRPVRIGQYQIIKQKALGGMAAVYKARDQDREVALKILLPELALQPALVARFHREAQLGSKLRHDHIVAYLEGAEVHGIHYLALEYIRGIDLDEYVAHKGRLGIKESRRLIVQAARALVHMHGQGIIHRDIKPANFLLTEKNGRALVKLIDLGLAREVADQESPCPRLGTIDYMAPEQARESRNADGRSDIYSLGCTWYYLLTGNPPFPDGTLEERLTRHREAEPPDIRRLNSAVTEAERNVLSLMLAKDPGQRYPTPEALLRDLTERKKER